MKSRQIYVLSALALAAGLAACGGGGGGGVPGAGPVTFTGSCQDGTKPTSTVSQASADGLCPALSTIVTSVAASTYGAGTERQIAFDQLNADRNTCGFGMLAQNTKLDTSAANHAAYTLANNEFSHSETPGRLGFTGAELENRLASVGYLFSAATENITFPQSGSFIANAGGITPSSLDLYSIRNGVRSLYTTIYHLQSMMSGQREIGMAENSLLATSPGGNLTTQAMVFNLATPQGQVLQTFLPETLATFPCQGIKGIRPFFTPESPDPFPDNNMKTNPYGQPVYLNSANGTTLNLSSGSITLRGGAAIPTRILNQGNDPQKRLKLNQAFLVPTRYMADNSTYDVVLTGTNSGMVTPTNPTGVFNRAFSFDTATFLTK